MIVNPIAMAEAATVQWCAAVEAVEKASAILLVAHLSPDGDAIGSLLGLANALKAAGKHVTTAVDDGVPEFLKFLPGSETIAGRLDSGEWELMISLDASDEERSGEVGVYGRAHSAQVINLDHHPTNTRFGDILLVLPEATSAAEIVFLWLERMGYAFAEAVATPLLTGLITDTLGFRTSNVNETTLAIAQRLMQAGAPLHEITARALTNRPYSYIDLWRYALPSVKMNGRVISAQVTQEDLKNARMKDVSDGGLVGLLISVDRAAIAVVFKERADGRVEIGFRAKPGYDVAGVAFALGGGGHKQASGTTIDGPLHAAIKRVMPLLRKAAKNGKAAIA